MTKLKKQPAAQNAENQQPAAQMFISLPISLVEWNDLKEKIQTICENTTATRKEINVDTIGIDEACKILGISVPTFHQWKKKGAIPFFKVGKFVKMKRADILSLKENGVCVD